jgi:hypothetical protein|tara:strand:- start:883 stop:1182 length:300 start_codon:yes stop_codon:yes gene_type:complete
MLGLNDIQYLYEFIFWLITFLILRVVWHKPKVRLGYAYVVAGFNLFAIVMYTLSSVSGEMDSLTSFSFAFLHVMVSTVMLTLVYKETKLENKDETSFFD